MSATFSLDGPDDPRAAGAVEALERGQVVVFPHLPFAMSNAETRFLDPAILARAKNVSLDPATGALSGSSLEGEDKHALQRMVARYAAWARALMATVAPAYAPRLEQRRTSFRPGPVDERVLSPRKDDRRLHVDAFPANPVQGRRILRVFTNVNTGGQGRDWQVGAQDFEAFATSFRARINPAVKRVQTLLQPPKGHRTDYDLAMLQLHDKAKLDEAWQAGVGKIDVTFPAGSSWIVYTDSVLHAALKGQHAFEQTFYLPLAAMREPERSPQRVLERLMGRCLIPT